MSRSRTRFLAIIAALSAGLLPAAAQSQDTETQVRVQVGAAGEVAPGAELSVYAQMRFQEGADDRVLTAALDMAVANWDLDGSSVELSGAVQVQDINGRTELRPSQQVTVAKSGFSFSTRLEQRFSEDTDRMGLRLRGRAQDSRAVAAGTTASLSAELLYQLRDRFQGGPRRVDQWRFMASARHRIMPQIDLAASYQFQIRPRPQGDTYGHIPQLSAAYRF